MPLSDISTIVYVMLENRSFDHMLGYLSLSDANPPMPVDGLRDEAGWMSRHDNFFAGRRYPLHAIGAETRIDDPPHEAATIATQINTPAMPGAAGGMGGFVASYMQRTPPPADPSLVMGYYTRGAVPVFDFLARNFAVCDHWFSALPTGTQANRLMAMSGTSGLVDNAPLALPDQHLVYDWLTERRVSWCAYQCGDFLPFFSLMPRWLPEIATSLTLSSLGGTGRFRRYSRFRQHWAGPAPLPSVIFIEPEYTDGPHADPNDDHPPTSVAKGQAFLSDIYATLTSNPARWRSTMMVVTYDEHGGFFDHVPPLAIPADAAGFRFRTTGVRVPALIVSPHVAPGSVFSGDLDHTSFLQLLADRFAPGEAYSDAVAARQAFLAPLRTVVDGPALVAAAPAMPAGAAMEARIAAAVPPAARSEAPNAAANSRALQNVALKVVQDHPDLMREAGWGALRQFAAECGPVLQR